MVENTAANDGVLPAKFEQEQFTRLKCMKICFRGRPKVYLIEIRLPSQRFIPIAVRDSYQEFYRHRNLPFTNVMVADHIWRQALPA